MRKMLLVPAHQYPFKDSNVDRAEKLDDEMQYILRRTDVSEYDKAQLYSQVLHKYLTLREQLIGKPTPSATTTADANSNKPKPDLGANSDANSPKLITIQKHPESSASEVRDDDLNKIKKTKRGRQLVQLIKNSRTLAWDPDHQLVVRGKTLKGTDVGALIKEAMDSSSPSAKKPSKHYQTFMRALEDEHGPTQLIGDLKYRQYLKGQKSRSPTVAHAHGKENGSPAVTRARGKENIPPTTWHGFD